MKFHKMQMSHCFNRLRFPLILLVLMSVLTVLGLILHSGLEQRHISIGDHSSGTDREIEKILYTVPDLSWLYKKNFKFIHDVGSPELIFGKAHRIFYRNIGAVIFVIVAALLSAVLLGHLFVEKSIIKLVDAIKCLAAENLSMHVGKSYGGEEIRNLARSFNAMTEMLQQGEADCNQVEMVLRSSAQRLQAVFQSFPAAVYTADRVGRVTLWNPTSEAMFGWGAQEVQGQVLPTIPKNQQHKYLGLLEQLLSGARLTNVESIRQKKDGSLIEINFSAAPLRDLTGNIIGIIEVAVDITERRKQGQKVRESGNKFRPLVEQVPVIHMPSRWMKSQPISLSRKTLELMSKKT